MNFHLAVAHLCCIIIFHNTYYRIISGQENEIYHKIKAAPFSEAWVMSNMVTLGLVNRSILRWRLRKVQCFDARATEVLMRC